MWTDVDKARSGGLPFVFEDNMSFERCEEWGGGGGNRCGGRRRLLGGKAEAGGGDVKFLCCAVLSWESYLI